MLFKEFNLRLLSLMVSTNTFLSAANAEEALHYNWNPGPRRGKEDAIEKQIAGKWHIITLQETCEFVEHEIFRERFHVTHYAGCAILFQRTLSTLTSASNLATFMRRGEVYKIKSLKENREGFTRYSFTCLFSSCCSQRSNCLHCIIAAHQQHSCQEKGIAKNIIQTIRATLLS